MYIYAMEIIWDQNKNRSNLQKHGVSFELAAQVFEDPLHLAVFDRIEDNEERWHALEATHHSIILLVVHTFRTQQGKECIRIISARKATPRERRQYEKGIDSYN